MDDLFNIAWSSLIAQQLRDVLVGEQCAVPNFELLPMISQHRLLPSPYILYPVRSSPICTLLKGRLRFW